MNKVELVRAYPLMKCGNVSEFKQRLDWLSQGMLANHLYPEKFGWKPRQEEIDLYNKYIENKG